MDLVEQTTKHHRFHAAYYCFRLLLPFVASIALEDLGLEGKLCERRHTCICYKSIYRQHQGYSQVLQEVHY